MISASLLGLLTLTLGTPGGYSSVSDTASRGSLTVIVRGLQSDRGTVKIAVSDSRENYYDYPSPRFGAAAPISDRTARWTFENLPYGEYALKVFHDENGNDELDTNFLGIPVEDYGFSNNASGLFGVPAFEKARFFLRAPSLIVTITVE